jgi:MFS family permease
VDILSRQHVANELEQNTSVWLALKNRVFLGLWLASVVSGVCVAAHDMAATWLMNTSGSSTLLLSLMATAASLPFFFFTFPAGALADLSDRRTLFIATYLWLAFAAGLLAVFSYLHLVHPYIILATVFLLGTGFAFNAPVWACVVPEIVRKEEIASAITLGGVQMNLAGIVGPALGSLLLSIVGSTVVFSLNALTFLGAAWVVSRVYHPPNRPHPHLEHFLESFASGLHYLRYTPGIQVILTRDFLFGLFIAAVPALLPVVALQRLRLTGSQLGLVFTAMGIGSLLGATLLLPYARAKATSNLLTILAGVLLVAVLVLMAIVQNLLMLLPVAALAGVSWTVSASELWIAGQRSIPNWARGRMNAVHMMASQGGVALGGVIWGAAAASLGIGATLVGGAVLLTSSLALAIPLSINFAQGLDLDPKPLRAAHDFPLAPKAEDGPVTITVELIIRPEDRKEFLALTKELRLIFLRNGAFLYRVEEILEHPGTFRTEMRVNSWAEHLRQHIRMTKAETALAERLRAMHAGEQELVVRHSLPANRMTTPLALGQLVKQFEARSAKPEKEGGDGHSPNSLGKKPQDGLTT